MPKHLLNLATQLSYSKIRALTSCMRDLIDGECQYNIVLLMCLVLCALMSNHISGKKSAIVKYGLPRNRKEKTNKIYTKKRVLIRQLD